MTAEVRRMPVATAETESFFRDLFFFLLAGVLDVLARFRVKKVFL